jgi:hypothetical protein
MALYSAHALLSEPNASSHALPFGRGMKSLEAARPQSFAARFERRMCSAMLRHPLCFLKQRRHPLL